MGLHPKSFGEQSLLQNTAGSGPVTGMCLQRPARGGTSGARGEGRAGDLCLRALFMTACPHQNRGGPGVPSTCHREEFAGKFFPCWFYLFYHGKKCTVSGVGQSLGASVADGDMEGLWVG